MIILICFGANSNLRLQKGTDLHNQFTKPPRVEYEDMDRPENAVPIVQFSAYTFYCVEDEGEAQLTVIRIGRQDRHQDRPDGSLNDPMILGKQRRIQE